MSNYRNNSSSYYGFANLLRIFVAYTSLLTNAIVDATSVKFDFLPIGHARVDPIIDENCPSDHVHTFYGPQSGVDPRRKVQGNSIHDDLIATSVATNTGNVEENKSMYWHPTVYKYDPTTQTYTRDTIGQSSAYYIWETGTTTAFPNLFRMIGGYDIEKSMAFAECVNSKSCKTGDCYSENTFFPTDRCDELEVSMRLPNCWDGVNLGDEPPHTNHVEYAEDSDFDGDCPDSHPIKLPQIQFFFRIFDYDGGWHTFSDDSSVFHTDYVSGWDSKFLQQVLDECENDGEGAMPNFFCENFLTFRDAPKCTDESTCDFSDPLLLEKLQSIQPNPPLDVLTTIINEETDIIVTGALPRGTCIGILIDDDDNESDDTSSPPTSSPIKINCQDKEDFRFRNKRKRDCDWVQNNSKCNKKWKKFKLKESCSVSCGICTPGDDNNQECVNEADLSETFMYKGKERDCDWVGNKPKKRCQKNSLRRKCQETCDYQGCYR